MSHNVLGIPDAPYRFHIGKVLGIPCYTPSIDLNFHKFLPATGWIYFLLVTFFLVELLCGGNAIPSGKPIAADIATDVAGLEIIENPRTMANPSIMTDNTIADPTNNLRSCGTYCLSL